MAVTEAYKSVEVQPVSGSLGAEVSGVDLGNLTDEQFDEIYRAFVAHQVIFFRDQEFDEVSYIEFARRWGDIMLYPYMQGLPDHPEILQILKEPEDTYVFGSQWHTDSSFIAIPPKATMLYAREIPPAGGDTAYSSMYRAYDTLSEGMKKILADLRVLNVGDQRIARFDELRSMKQQDPGEVQTRAYHPLIRTHPDTGKKALNVGAHSVEIEGLTKEESTSILEFLYHHGTRPEFGCRFQWREGTVGIWDNRCVQHYAIDDYQGQRRRMQRITIAGEEAPF